MWQLIIQLRSFNVFNTTNAHKKTTFTLLVLTLLLSTAANLKWAYGQTSVSVSPTTLNVGSSETELPTTFNVNITVGSVSNLYGWQVNLTFDPTIVQVTSAFLPPNNVFSDKKPIAPPAQIDNTKGRLLLGANVGPGQTTFSGSGILCTVKFKAIAPGTSPLTLVTKGSLWDLLTFLYDQFFFDIEPVDFTSGQVTVSGYIPIPKYTNVKVSPSYIAADGTKSLPVPFSVNITVQNATELIGWQINVTFSPTILQAVNITRPSDDVFANKTTISTEPIIDNSTGFVSWNTTIAGDSPFSGNGTLCQIQFQGIALGYSELAFSAANTGLLNSTYQIILSDMMSGMVQVVKTFKKAVLQVAPYRINVSEPSSFVLVNITVANATDLYEWGIHLEFNSSLLKVHNYSIPLNNVFAGREVTFYPDPPYINDTASSVNSTGSFIWGSSVASGLSFYGNGTLCQIWFQSATAGFSNMTFSSYGEDTFLLNSKDEAIPADVIDAGRPPIERQRRGMIILDLAIIAGPLAIFAGFLVVVLIVRLRRRRLEQTGASPIFIKEKTR
jgi:hypothetical protein